MIAAVLADPVKRLEPFAKGSGTVRLGYWTFLLDLKLTDNAIHPSRYHYQLQCFQDRKML